MFKYYQDVYRLQAAVPSAFDSRARSEKYSLLQSIALLMSQGVTNNPKKDTCASKKDSLTKHIVYIYVYIIFIHARISMYYAENLSWFPIWSLLTNLGS